MAIIARRPDNVQHRIAVAMVGIAMLYFGLIGRLVYLQVIAGNYWRTRATDLRSERITLPAKRGAILDRDGKPLALTTTSSALVCDPTLVKQPAKTAELLASVLAMPADSLVPLLTPELGANGKPKRCVELCAQLQPNQIDAIHAARRTRGDTELLQGIVIQDREERVYPSGSDAVHVVGYMGPARDGVEQGMMGIEAAFNPVLAGKDGVVNAELDARRRVIPSTQRYRIDPRNGRDMQLTIDSAAQHIVATELAKCVEEHHPVGATAIVMEPKTGNILALASWPDFDPVTRIELAKDPGGFCDRALSLYEPGSTMKVITAATALRDGAITPSTTFYCGGSMKIGSRIVRCASHGGRPEVHGTETVRGIIANSCNVGAAQIGVRVGMARLRQGLADFGLLDPTGVGLPGDSRGRLGFGAEANDVSITKVSRVAFGQSVVVTPLALTTAYAAIANGGVLMRPRLVEQELDANGKTVQYDPPQAVRRVLTPQLSQYMVSLMRGVVTKGTGKDTQVAGYTSAGKTGTAQKVTPGSRGYAPGKYVASFIGFIPAQNPRAVICVVIDEPHDGYYGAEVAGPVWREIARQLMYRWNVRPDDPATAEPARLASRR